MATLLYALEKYYNISLNQVIGKRLQRAFWRSLYRDIDGMSIRHKTNDNIRYD